MNRLVAIAFFLYCVLPSSLPAQAEVYPNHAVKIIVPFGPGGTTDIIARVLAEELKNSLGQPFVVENKPGADGILAIQELVRSGGDGYAFMIGNVSTNAITPVLYADRMSLDYGRDVVPVMRLVDVPAFLVATTKDFQPTTMAEFIAYARDNPGKVNFGTTGVGSYPHYDMVLFAKRAGDLKLTAIPNKGGASGMINDLLVGTVQVSFVNSASASSSVKSGMLRALAVVNHMRLAAFPDVPVMQELGFAGVGTIAWQGLFASASAPREVLEKLRQATAQALRSPEVIRVLRQQEFNIFPTDSLDEASEWLKGDMDNWKNISHEINFQSAN
jgi:tripartite-type tricarboxylate transporter receptor subunit TctC